MIKFVYRLFKKELTQMVWDETYKPDRMRGLKFAMVCEGHKFFVYNNLFDVPIERMGRVQDYIIQLNRVVSNDELANFIQNMEQALFNATSGDKVKDLAKIGFLIGELKSRKEMLLHPEIMMELAGALYIREDQDPAEWNDEFEHKKVEMFRKNYTSGQLYDFFVTAGLSQFFPNFESLEKDWMVLWEQSTARLQAMEEMLKSSL
jgi:hypothetical protein